MNLGFTNCISLGEGMNLPLLKIYALSSDKVLGVVAALDCYIERTSISREKKSGFSVIV